MKKREKIALSTSCKSVNWYNLFGDGLSLTMYGLCPSNFASKIYAKAMIRNVRKHEQARR